MIERVMATPEALASIQLLKTMHTQLIIDVVEGPEGKAFHTRSRLFTDKEMTEIELQP